jgi:hypothetical protein
MAAALAQQCHPKRKQLEGFISHLPLIGVEPPHLFAIGVEPCRGNGPIPFFVVAFLTNVDDVIHGNLAFLIGLGCLWEDETPQSKH